VRRARRLALAAALALAAVLVVQPAHAQSGRAWRPGDRVLVTRFAEVGAVAADLRTVYAASELGLERYDFGRRRWQDPVTVLDGYPVAERPQALAVDAAANALWLATALGGLYSYDISFGRWRRVPVSTPGPITALVAASDGLWIYAQPNWLHLQSGSFFADVVPPGQLPAAIRAQGASPLQQAARTDPYLASALGSLGVSERLRHWPVTSAVPGDRAGSWWLGTWGGNLLRFEGHTGESERLDFGLLSSGVSALAGDGTQLWFGGDGRDRWTGVTRASGDLGDWRSWDSREDGAPDAAVLAILPAPDAVWFAAGDGLFRLDRRSQRFTRLDEHDLPSATVSALAPAPGGGVWAGTRAGLALVGADGRVQGHWLAGNAVHQLALAGDTLWLASDAGLLVLPDVSRAFASDPAAADSARRAAVAIQPAPDAGALAGRVLGALPAAGALWALTPNAVWRRDPSAGWLPARDATLASIGEPLALAPDAAGLWVAGANGIARWDAGTRAWRSFTVGPDLPAGPVRAVLAVGDAVWAATPAGAVRLPLRF
jgi:ligand-binding sensor domain-containing protein